MNQNSIKIFVLLLLGICSTAFLTGCGQSVQSGTVGIKKSLGEIDSEPLLPGFRWRKPFIESIEEYNIQMQTVATPSNSASKDLQSVETNVSVSFSPNPTLAPKLSAAIGNVEELAAGVLSPAIQESVKAVTARYTAEELVTKRSEVKTGIDMAIKSYIDAVLSDKDLQGGMTINAIALTDFKFSAEFNSAIEQKVKAEQEALRAKNDKMKRVTDAEAARDEQNLKTEANAFSVTEAATASAFAIEAESIARAAAIEREALALAKNPGIVELRQVEKWNGVLPTFNAGAQNPMSLLLSVDPKKPTPAQTTSEPGF